MGASARSTSGSNNRRFGQGDIRQDRWQTHGEHLATAPCICRRHSLTYSGTRRIRIARPSSVSSTTHRMYRLRRGVDAAPRWTASCVCWRPRSDQRAKVSGNPRVEQSLDDDVGDRNGEPGEPARGRRDHRNRNGQHEYARCHKRTQREVHRHSALPSWMTGQSKDPVPPHEGGIAPVSARLAA